jgi:hypothetical protein
VTLFLVMGFRILGFDLIGSGEWELYVHIISYYFIFYGYEEFDLILLFFLYICCIVFIMVYGFNVRIGND